MPHRPEAYTKLISGFLYPLYQHDTDHKKPDPFPCRTLLSCPENLTGAVKPPPCNCSSFSSFTRNKMDGGIGTIEGLIFRRQAPC